MSRLSLADLFKDWDALPGTAGTPGTGPHDKELLRSRSSIDAGNTGSNAETAFPSFPAARGEWERKKSRAIKAVPAVPGVPGVPGAKTSGMGSCRYCGDRINWAHPDALAFADGSAAHGRCLEDAEVRRIERAAERGVTASAMSDPAEITLRGELGKIEEEARS